MMSHMTSVLPAPFCVYRGFERPGETSDVSCRLSPVMEFERVPLPTANLD